MDRDPAEPGLLANGFVQMAYVTNDQDAAIDLFREKHDVAGFMELRDYELAVTSSRKARVDIALAWVGGIQIELIRPISGSDGIFREQLSDGDAFAMRFHHEAQRVASLEVLAALKARAIVRGLAVPVDGADAYGSTYFYVDCRSTLGHYVEYIFYPEELWAQLSETIPVNY
jgi:hypothetical protein